MKGVVPRLIATLGLGYALTACGTGDTPDAAVALDTTAVQDADAGLTDTLLDAMPDAQPDSGDPPDNAASNDTPLAAETTDSADENDAPDGMDAPDGADAPDETGAPDAPDATDTADVADAAAIADSSTDADAADVPDTLDDAAGDADSDAGLATDADASAADSGQPDIIAPDIIAPADTGPPPVYTPIAPQKLPKAQITDITYGFAIKTTQSYAPCAMVGDVDGDGRDDIVVVERIGAKARIDAILIGKALPKHVFTDYDTTQVVPDMGCSLVDLDGDGKLDVLSGGLSGAMYYAGVGDGTFKDKTAAWLPWIMDFAAWSLVPADLDGDGDLDLYIGAGPGPGLPVSGGSPCGQHLCSFSATDFTCLMKVAIPPSPLFQDRVLLHGAKLPLADVTAAWNVPADGLASSAAAMDIDGDGKLDIVVGDDFGTHRLLANNGKKFTVYGTDIGFHPYCHAMGWGFGDFDHNGKVDLILADLGPSPLYMQVAPTAGKPVRFVDKGGESGVWEHSWGASSWVPTVADYNNDGLDDIYLSGAVVLPPAQMATITGGCGNEQFDSFPGIDVLFLGKPGGGFTAWRGSGGGPSDFGNIALSLIDIDDDGDLDMVQARPDGNLMANIRILRNDLPKVGKSFKVTLTGKGKNTAALGSKVSAMIGGKLVTRWLNGSGGFGGTRARRALFGLGNNAKATAVTVTWPDGKTTVVGDMGPGGHKQLTWP